MLMRTLAGCRPKQIVQFPKCKATTSEASAGSRPLDFRRPREARGRHEGPCELSGSAGRNARGGKRGKTGSPPTGERPGRNPQRQSQTSSVRQVAPPEPSPRAAGGVEHVVGWELHPLKLRLCLNQTL